MLACLSLWHFWSGDWQPIKKPVPKVLFQNRWRMRSEGNGPAQIHVENSHWNRGWLFARAVDGGYARCCNLHFTHTHFTALFQGLFRWVIARRKLFWSLWCKRRYQRQTHKQSGWAPLHLDWSATHLPHLPIFTPDSLPATTLPIYPGLRRHQICWLAYPVAWFCNWH